MIAEAVHLRRRTLGIIRFNISFALKAVFLGLAPFGYSSRWLAILSDTAATLLVVANALRPLRPKHKPEDSLLPKRPKRKDVRRKTKGRTPWMVPGLFGGMLLGFIAELIFGISMFWMAGGGLAGLGIGALADLIRRRSRRHTDEL